MVPASAAVKPPPGAATPVAGSGIGTAAALNNPKCNTGEQYGVYGRFNSTFVGGGAVCVKPWKDGANNGGATSPGVTKDAITVVAVVPNDVQINSPGGTAPTNRNGNTRGNYQDAVHDFLLPQMKYYETWGRDLDVKILVSSGNDETAQRADVVAAKAVTPFAVVNFVPAGLDVFDAEMAKAKILVFGYATTAKKALAQAPYRWGLTDVQANAVNAAEVLGKQLVGKKAQFGGDDVKTADPHVRCGLHRRHDRHRAIQDRPAEVQGHPRGRRELPRQRVAARRCDNRAGAGAGHRDQAEAGRRDDGRALHRRRHDHRAHGERDEAGVVAGVVLHRHGVPGSRAPGAARIPSSSRRTPSGSPMCPRGCSPIRRLRHRRSR